MSLGAGMAAAFCLPHNLRFFAIFLVPPMLEVYLNTRVACILLLKLPIITLLLIDV